MKTKTNCLIISCALFLVAACSKQQQPTQQEEMVTTTTVTDQTATTQLVAKPIVYNDSIGAPMLRKEANEWKKRYQAVYGPRVTYRVKANYVKQLLSQRTDIVCLSFFYIRTNKGLDIIPIAITKPGHVVRRATITTATGQELTWEQAKGLRNSYEGATKALILGKRPSLA